MRALDLVSIHAAGSGHPGGTLSVMDIVAVLFLTRCATTRRPLLGRSRPGVLLRRPQGPGPVRRPRRGRVLSERGRHACASSAARARAIRTRRPARRRGLERLAGPGSRHRRGMRPGRAHGRAPCRVYCIMGDGEQQEGSVWEAAMAAGHYGLDNLCAIVDKNRLQIDGPVEGRDGRRPARGQVPRLRLERDRDRRPRHAGRSRRRSGRPAPRRAADGSSSPTRSRARASPSWRTRPAGTAWPRRDASSWTRHCADIGSPSDTPSARPGAARRGGRIPEARRGGARGGGAPVRPRLVVERRARDMKVEMDPTRVGFGAAWRRTVDDRASSRCTRTSRLDLDHRLREEPPRAPRPRVQRRHRRAEHDAGRRRARAGGQDPDHRHLRRVRGGPAVGPDPHDDLLRST